MHFIRRVEIRRIRFYVDYNDDESYTPTRIRVEAGTGWHDLQELCEMVLPNPVGWQEVAIAGAGAGVDGNSLACWIFQLVILENHQNGKDTHIRGLKVYALDDTAASMSGPGNPMGQMLDAIDVARTHSGRSPGRMSNIGHGARAPQRVGSQIDAPSHGYENGDESDMLSWVSALEDRVNQGGAPSPGEAGLGVPDFMRDPEIR